MKARRNMGDSNRGQRYERTSVMLRTGMYPMGQFYGATGTSKVTTTSGSSASAVGDVASGLAQMVGMITSTAIAAKSAQNLAQTQGRQTRRQTEAEAALVEKQGLLAQAQAQLVSAQQGYLLPLTAVALGGLVVLGIYVARK